MRAKLSPKLVEHLKAPGPKRLDVWDTVLQCFGEGLAETGAFKVAVSLAHQGKTLERDVASFAVWPQPQAPNPGFVFRASRKFMERGHCGTGGTPWSVVESRA